MKTFLCLLTILLISCDLGQLDNNQYLIDSKSDSIIIRSNKSILVSDTVNRISDSLTTTKVDNIVKEIQYLTKYVEKLRIEKLNLTRELKFSKENVRIDTVFVETKKSFWGKTKTTINTKTDSLTKESIDSTLTQTTDTIK